MLRRNLSAKETLVLPPQYSGRLFKSSFLTVASVVTAAQYELWACCGLTLLVFLTSVNYWRHPVHGWRRNLDMLAVFCGMSYHLYTARFVPSGHHQLVYYGLALQIFVCYFKARSSHDKDAASKWHMTMHLVGNIANCLLYMVI
ncbi:hypothetical protein SDRG_06379 [Saprolegnia diclina VS20]|uniref:Post-GPI attachment to proteins factor 3 n=1 Tax=Saprolegnia diclina (strain VS20) TaxID=1156394 RepID=T0QEE1_SAPDV|nr:hypothetical protein SDRG_06379 [Saprolegnia diclina VS20]EQC36274.1 hypothetical protein SDRG_06379 [Saprolegnia diclina VS20]|eukprot:XP_008610380.1 hypothetical protein SDRG_06379 [Saprolegnia diclina VS20]